MKPVYYLMEEKFLEKSITRILNMHENSSLDPKDLIDYIYPKEYKDNFLDFVNEILEGGNNIERCFNYGQRGEFRPSW